MPKKETEAKEESKKSDMVWNGSNWVRYNPDLQKEQAEKNKKIEADRETIQKLQQEIDELQKAPLSQDEERIRFLEKELAALKEKLG